MDEPRLGVLGVIEPAVDPSACWASNHDRRGLPPPIPVAQRGRLVDDLVESTRDEVAELHLGDRSEAQERRAYCRADDARL